MPLRIATCESKKMARYGRDIWNWIEISLLAKIIIEIQGK